MNQQVFTTKNRVKMRAGEQLAGASRTSLAQIRRPDVHRSYIIPVLSKAIEVIRLLEETDHPLNANEIARATGVSKTTVYRILRTLSAYGFLPQGSDGIYSFQFVPCGRAVLRKSVMIAVGDRHAPYSEPSQR